MLDQTIAGQKNDRIHYPFCAVVGQSAFKLALILNAIHPRVGGVLVRGPRGSAKSTLARALADILPSLAQNSELSRPFVTLPLGTSDEMLTGTLNLQQVLNEQKLEFQPGVFAKAHQGVLYVDEVNLLNDALVDLLLDVSASGINCVERDGISHQHVANFVLLGTMNPDEGELRAQLQDRFGLAVDLLSQYSLDERIEIVRRRESFDQDPQSFIQHYQSEQDQLALQIENARSLLPDVRCCDALRRQIAQRCAQANVDGLRADIIWFRAATAYAAWQGRCDVSEQDIDALEELVLAHRRQASPNPPPTSGQQASKPPSPYTRPTENTSDLNSGSNSGSNLEPKTDASNGQWGSMAPQVQNIQEISSLALAQQFEKNSSEYRRQSNQVLSQVSKHKGQMSGGTYPIQEGGRTPNWFSSLLKNQGAWPPEQLVYRKKQGGQSILNFVLLDTSGSTVGSQLMAQAKGVVTQIAKQAYLQREQLSILGFGNDQLEDILPRGRAPKNIKPLLSEVTSGGGTPIRTALLQTENYLRSLLRKLPELLIQCYLITDGRTRQKIEDIHLPGRCTLIDIEQSAVKRGRGQSIAKALGAQYIALPSFKACEV